MTITDLESRININTADSSVLLRALTYMGVDASEAPAIGDAILDWIDSDSAAHMNGAESDYYQSMDPPYLAKNGPIDDLSELLLVRGVTHEMVLGSRRGQPCAGLLPARPPVGRGL